MLIVGCRWSVAAWILRGGNARRTTSDLNQLLATVAFWLQGFAAEGARVENDENDGDHYLSQLVSSILLHARFEDWAPIGWHLSEGYILTSFQQQASNPRRPWNHRLSSAPPLLRVNLGLFEDV
jgi:hypothetical protein